jgi:cytochrome c
LLEKPDTITLVILFAGVGGAALLLGAVFFAIRRSELLNFKTVLPLLLIVLVAMLLTRQLIQNKKIIPLENRVTANALTYDQELQPYAQAALTRYQASLALSYDRAETLYLRSCAFCHGKNAAGNGIEAKNLEVPPENLAAMRTTREYLYKIILGGVRGTGMGYFSIYDRYQLDNLITYLHEKYQVLGPPGELPAAIPPQALARSEDMYRQTCAVCHGLDGQGAALSQGFQPPPPNLALYSLTPVRTFAVITQGYPGTMMPAFGDAPEEVRWGLVKIVNLKRMSKN